MGAVWSILALIIGVVVAYLMYEEYVVGREGAEESDLEKDIQEDLAAMVVEAGITEAAAAAPQRTETGEFVHEAASQPATGAAVAANVAAAAVKFEDASIEETTETVEASEEAAIAEEVVAVEAYEEAAIAEEVVADETVVEDAVVEEDVVVADRVAVAAVDVPDEAVAVVEPDDLTKIKGIGKVYAQRLNEAGIYTFAQVIDTDVETLEKVTRAIPAANPYDWARQAAKLS